MKPVRTKATTGELGAPVDWDHSVYSCSALPVATHNGVMYSYWKPTLWEWLMLVLGRPVRLAVSGRGHPPVALEVTSKLEARS